MKYKFSARSLEKIGLLNPQLKSLVCQTMQLQIFDFGIIETYRNQLRQDLLFEKGLSKVKYPDSKHNTKPSLAFDFALYFDNKINYEDKNAYYMAVGIFKAVAASLGIKIRCGADWDGDFRTTDQTFHDLGHIELLN